MLLLQLSLAEPFWEIFSKINHWPPPHSYLVQESPGSLSQRSLYSLEPDTWPLRMGLATSPLSPSRESPLVAYLLWRLKRIFTHCHTYFLVKSLFIAAYLITLMAMLSFELLTVIFYNNSEASANTNN